MNRPVVLKFGGASVATPESFANIATIVGQRHRTGVPVVVVVSAMGSATDDLFALARRVHPEPPQRELDMLVSAGERISIALLAMALARQKIPAVSFTGSQAGILTSDAHTEALILDVRPVRVPHHLERGEVVIVAGFQGVSRNKEITTLGRGGSDTTAVALAVALDATHVEFFKDVDGIYERDPKKDPTARRCDRLDYPKALELARAAQRGVLAPRCLQLAERNGMPLEVLSFHSPDIPGTRIEGKREDGIRTPVYEEERDVARV